MNPNNGIVVYHSQAQRAVDQALWNFGSSSAGLYLLLALVAIGGFCLFGLFILPKLRSPFGGPSDRSRDPYADPYGAPSDFERKTPRGPYDN